MEQFRKFLRSRGFVLALAACLLAALAAGVWSVRLIRARLEENLDPAARPDTARTAEPDTGGELAQEDAVWEQQTAPAANSMTGQPEKAASAPQGSSAASPQPGSGSGSVSEPPALRVESAPPAASGGSAFAPPVSGRVLNAFSGDNLVYSKTLGDWRTHNGTDYACAEGDAVRAPAAGTVTAVGTDGNWGPVVELTDSAGRVWRLCGVASPKVRQGDTVKAGQTLGRAGSIGCECAEETHIHLEVKNGEEYLDPASLLG